MKSIEEAIKTKKFKNAHHKAFVNLLYTSNWALGLQDEMFKLFDITSTQYNILRIIKGNGNEPISVSEIKERILYKNTDITRMLNRLIDKNLITREICITNRRKMEVNLTNEAEDLLKKIAIEIDLKIGSKIEKQLSNKEAEALSLLLDKIRF